MRKISKKIRFNWLFLLLIIGILLFDNFKNFIIYFLVVGLHELAHFIVAKKLGYKLNKFYIMPYGVCLNYENIVFQGNDEFLIALAGPLFNYLLCVICLAIWWLFPITYYYLDYFCFCNLLLATFNILPYEERLCEVTGTFPADKTYAIDFAKKALINAIENYKNNLEKELKKNPNKKVVKEEKPVKTEKPEVTPLVADRRNISAAKAKFDEMFNL